MHRGPRIRRISSLVLPAILVGCGDGDGTGPDPRDLTGAWSITWTNMAAEGVSCATSPIRFQIVQTGDEFYGNSEARWTLTCSDSVETTTQRATGAALREGRVTEEGEITFIFATSGYQQTGTVSGRSMTGPATWTVNFGLTTVLLVGQFNGFKH